MTRTRAYHRRNTDDGYNDVTVVGWPIDRYGVRKDLQATTSRWKRLANCFLFLRSHIYNAPYWLILKEFNRITGVLQLRNGTIAEKKAARDTLHDLWQRNNSLQSRCLCRSTICLFLIASRNTRDSIHHTWNVTTKNLTITKNETSKPAWVTIRYSFDSFDFSFFIFCSSLLRLF